MLIGLFVVIGCICFTHIGLCLDMSDDGFLFWVVLVMLRTLVCDGTCVSFYVSVLIAVHSRCRPIHDIVDYFHLL